jgi:hypothetical protein
MRRINIHMPSTMALKAAARGLDDVKYVLSVLVMPSAEHVQSSPDTLLMGSCIIQGISGIRPRLIISKLTHNPTLIPQFNLPGSNFQVPWVLMRTALF